MFILNQPEVEFYTKAKPVSGVRVITLKTLNNGVKKTSVFRRNSLKVKREELELRKTQIVIGNN